MAHFDFNDGTLTTDRFGDTIHIEIPRGGKVEIQTTHEHSDVEIREANGAVVRRFRLLQEDDR